jgi:ankyrin repeat protein
MPPKRQAQVSVVELQHECRHDEESNNKCARNTNGNEQQQQDPGLDFKQPINLPPPPQDNDAIITQFKPVQGQWELADVNIKLIDQRSGETILHNYCKYINTTPLDVFKLLIDTKGCDVNAQDNYGDTPIHLAFRYFDPNKGGDINVLTYLLSQKGVNANIKGRNGNTILHHACDNINRIPLKIYQYLIETLGCDINAQNNDNDIPLYLAFNCFYPNYGGDITVLAYLLSQKGVNVNIKDESGETLLHKACHNILNLPLDVFKLLIETMGCDVNAQDDYNYTPLHDALLFFDPNESGDYLGGDNMTVLMYLLGHENVNVNLDGQFAYTLLHYACEKIDSLPLDVFKVLIEKKGWDVNQQDKRNKTPVYYALRYFTDHFTDIKVLMYLLCHENVNVNIKNESGETLLHAACENINNLSLDVFKLLIEKKGCGVNVQDKCNNTPVHIASREFNPNKGDITVLVYLINQNNLNVNIKNEKGYYLLHSACPTTFQAISALWN